VISASNRDLSLLMRDGKFREDLFYRLNVITVRLPPLRERAQDIEHLALLHLTFLAAHSGKAARGFSNAAIEAMMAYRWPGNLRELRNVIERAVILSESDQIEVGDLSDTIQPASEVHLGGRFTLEQIESEHLRRLIANHKTLEEVAEILKIDPATLYRKRKRL
jgi:two-component system, NtrC family, response regulator AlgB